MFQAPPQGGNRIGGEDAAGFPSSSNEKTLNGAPGYHYEQLTFFASLGNHQQSFGRCSQFRLDGGPESAGEAAVITGDGPLLVSSQPPPHPTIYT